MAASPTVAAEQGLATAPGGDLLQPGTEAPDFRLPDQGGNPVRLSDLRGRWVLLWWYPMADTPG